MVLNSGLEPHLRVAVGVFIVGNVTMKGAESLSSSAGCPSAGAPADADSSPLLAAGSDSALLSAAQTISRIYTPCLPL